MELGGGLPPGSEPGLTHRGGSAVTQHSTLRSLCPRSQNRHWSLPHGAVEKAGTVPNPPACIHGSWNIESQSLYSSRWEVD